MAEYLPSAHAILWFLAAFVSLWGWSLVWRGFTPEGPKPRRWWQPRWRLAGPGLGVQVPAAAAAFFGAWAYGMVQSGWEGLSVAAAPVGPWTAAGWGVLAFAAVVAVIGYRGDRAKGRLRCRRCWYDMSAAVAAEGGARTCPECGKVARNERDLSRPRRRWRVVAAGLVIALASYGVMIVPRVREGGWIAAVPTTAMIVALPWLPEPLLSEGLGDAENDESLYGRYQETNWRWQDVLVHAWARRVVKGAQSTPDRLEVAMKFIDPEEDQDLAIPLHARVLSGLVSDDQAQRSTAAKVMDVSAFNQGMPPIDTPLVGKLVAGLDDRDPLVATWCATFLGECGLAAEPAVDRLLEMVGPSAQAPAIHAVFALRSIAIKSIATRRRVTDAFLASNGRRARMLSIVLASSQHPVDAEMRARLMPALSYPDDDVAVGAAVAMARGGVKDEEFITAVLREARSTRGSREGFVGALWHIDDVASVHVPEVSALLSDSSPVVREGAADLLCQWAMSGVEISAARPALESLADGAGPDAESARRALEAGPIVRGVIEREVPEGGG